MAIRIKDVATLANKFATRAAAAQADYKTGVEAAGGEWEANTAASEGTYQAGVQEAIAAGRYAKGVRASGAAHYVRRASELGSQRFVGGVQAGKDRWAQNTAPALQVIAGLTLPPRGPRRSPQNQQRSAAVATALGAWRQNK
jgi:hypothetical protein